MALVGDLNLTLLDVSKRKNVDGKVATIIELIAEINEVSQDLTFVQCNDGSAHRTTVRTGQPQGTWRKMYSGVQSTKSTTMQVKDACGYLEALPKIDERIVDNSEDPEGVLMSEQIPHINGMTEQMMSTLFYGDTDTYPERFMGLDPRYNTLSTDENESGYNVFDAGGTGADNTSVWLVVWGPMTCHMIYPQGSQAGIKVNPLPKQLVSADDSSGDFMAYVTQYKWDMGLALRDWRSVGRIANIDVSDLEADAGSQADLIKLMVRLTERVKMKNLGRAVWYMHERVRTMLRIQMLGTSNVNLTFENVEGKRVLMFDQHPIRVCDAILLTESQIT